MNSISVPQDLQVTYEIRIIGDFKGQFVEVEVVDGRTENDDEGRKQTTEPLYPISFPGNPEPLAQISRKVCHNLASVLKRQVFIRENDISFSVCTKRLAIYLHVILVFE